ALVPATTYTLSLHDALPILPDGYPKERAVFICVPSCLPARPFSACGRRRNISSASSPLRSAPISRGAPNPSVSGCRNIIRVQQRSEEHTSELQSRENLVCRL